jgi:hypothetical protein
MAKSTSALRGMRDIRTIAGTKNGSIPRTRESPYLRLHMLWTNNDRLSREYASAEKRRLSLERRMKENRDESARLAPQGGAEVPSPALTTPRRPRRTSVSAVTVRHLYGGHVTACEGD